MEIIINKTKELLNQMIELDWNKFNQMGLFEQGDVLLPFKERFEKIVKDYNKKNNAYFRGIDSLLDSYLKEFEKIRIEGKNKSLFRQSFIDGKGGRSILDLFHRILSNIEYEESKKNSNLKCDCELALKFKRDPKTNTFKHVGYLDDDYDMIAVHKCKECDSEWITYVTEDDMGETVWEKYSSGEHQSIAYFK